MMTMPSTSPWVIEVRAPASSSILTSTPTWSSSAVTKASAAGLASSRTTASVRRDPPAEKISPNMTMKTSGKASVQNSAARSRT